MSRGSILSSSTRFTKLKLFGTLSLLLLAGACTQNPLPTPPVVTPPVPITGEVELTILSDLARDYRPGDSKSATFGLSLSDPQDTVTSATVFLNLVQETVPGRYTQVMHLIFEDAAEHPQLFRTPLTGQTLQAGIETTLRFRIRRDAPPGNYSLAVQVFEGTNTNPNAVQLSQRLGIQIFPVSIGAP